MGSTLVFDLETQKTFDEVGGRDNLHQLRLSVGVLQGLESGDVRTYREERASDLVRDLLVAERVIGYNVVQFDYRVLARYTSEDFSAVPTIDLLLHLKERLGFRPRLDDVVLGTLGRAKSADGLQAVAWFREGKLDEIEAYCRCDVELTRQLYLFGREHGHVLIAQRNGQQRRVEVSW